MQSSYLAGNPTVFIGGVWVYADTLEPVAGNDRQCVRCAKMYLANGHDACLGTLRGVVNACCGHGIDSEAFVHVSGDEVVRGREALRIIAELKSL